MNRRKQLRPVILDEIEEWTQQYLTPFNIVSSDTNLNPTQCANTNLRTQSTSSRSRVEHADTSKNTCFEPAYIPELPSWLTSKLDYNIPDSHPSTGELQGKMYVNHLHAVRVDSFSGSDSLPREFSDEVGNQNTTCITEFESQNFENLFDPALGLNTNTSLDLELDFNDWIDLNSSSELCSSNRDLEVISRPTSTCATTATRQGKKSDTYSISKVTNNTTIPSFEACLLEFDSCPTTSLVDDTFPEPIRAQESETSTQEGSSTRGGSKRKANAMNRYRENESKKSSQPPSQRKKKTPKFTFEL